MYNWAGFYLIAKDKADARAALNERIGKKKTRGLLGLNSTPIKECPPEERLSMYRVDRSDLPPPVAKRAIKVPAKTSGSRGYHYVTLTSREWARCCKRGLISVIPGVNT